MAAPLTAEQVDLARLQLDHWSAYVNSDLKSLFRDMRVLCDSHEALRAERDRLRGTEAIHFRARMEAEAAVATLRGQVEAKGEALAVIKATLRTLRDVVGKIHGNAEDCEDCGDKSEAGNDTPCEIHGSMEFWPAFQAANEVLGPCVCGHHCSEHFDEDTTRCKKCACEYFKLPPALLPETKEPRP